MELLISRQTRLYPSLRPRRRLTSAITALLQRESVAAEVEISLLLCDDSYIHALNLEHRNIDKPTDVLSFPQYSQAALTAGNWEAISSPDGLPIGDVAISLETADRQAAAAAWPLINELCLLAVHGVLHLLGYDDETVEGAREMREKTISVLQDSRLIPSAALAHPYFIEYN